MDLWVIILVWLVGPGYLQQGQLTRPGRHQNLLVAITIRDMAIYYPVIKMVIAISRSTRRAPSSAIFLSSRLIPVSYSASGIHVFLQVPVSSFVQS